VVAIARDGFNESELSLAFLPRMIQSLGPLCFAGATLQLFAFEPGESENFDAPRLSALRIEETAFCGCSSLIAAYIPSRINVPVIASSVATPFG
jgi:hypothetical protein